MQAPQSGGGMMSGLMGTMAQGFAFGTGSAMAHRAVGAAAESLFGGKEVTNVTASEVAATPVASVCGPDKDAFYSCLQTNDAEKCQNLFQALQACQENAQFNG